MRYAILSDVHANPTALDAVLADARACGAERVVSLGDVVGYGPSPAEALHRLRAAAAVALAGNHDDAVSGRLDPADFIDLAADAVARHREALAKADLAWLASLPHTASIEGAALAHGDLVNPAAFDYIDDEASAAANFAATEAELVFVGHTHTPGIFLVGQSGNVHALAPQDFTCEAGKRYIVNVGSVGYPRAANGECLSSYVLYDSAARTVVFRFLPFAVSSVLQRGRNPKRLAKRVLAAAALAIALAAGALAFLLSPKAEVRVGHDPALRIAGVERTLTLPAGTAKVKPGLELAAKSDPVDLEIVFRSAANATLETYPKPRIVKSANAAVKVPSGAVTAQFVLYRRKPSDTPVVKSFEPLLVK